MGAITIYHLLFPRVVPLMIESRTVKWNRHIALKEEESWTTPGKDASWESLV
jgi:hypothetical protein